MKNLVNTLLLFTVLSLVISCDINDQLYQDAPDSKVLFATDDLEREIYLAPTVDEQSYELLINRSGINNDNAVEVMIDTDPEVLQQYNEDMGSNFKLLPNDYYNFQNTVAIDKGSQLGKTEVNIKARKAVDELEGYGVYAIPLKIVQSNGASINEDKSSIVLIVNVREPVVRQEKYGIEDATSMGNSMYTGTFTVFVEFENEWDIDLGYEVDLELVDVFNNANGTEYKPLPENSIQTIPDSFTLSAGNNSVAVEIELSVNELYYFEPYLLPIRLQSMGDFPVDPDREIIYLRLTRDFDMNNAEVVSLTNDMIETFTQESVEGPKESLVDGDTSTYWHSAWSSGVEPLPHWIQINFEEPTELGGLNYTLRQPSGITDRPNHFDIQTSDDGENWTTVWESRSGLSVEPVDEMRTLVFDQNYTSQMFRIRILDTYGSRSWTHLSTIEVFRVTE